MSAVTALRDFLLEVHFSKWEFNAKYNLAGSDAENMTVSELLALASDNDRRDFDHTSLAYTETFGARALRSEIAATYDAVTPEHVLCFAGAEEGIYVGMKTLLSADDHAIVITPNYQSAETVPVSICDVTGVALDSHNNWELDVDRVAAVIRPATKLLYINFPHNPTGKIISRETFDAIVALCDRHGIWLFSDEVYRLLERDGALRLPQAVDVYERAISLNVMSKAYGLPGLRIGWVACRDRALLVRFERYKHFLSICNAAPSEVLARIALAHRETILERNRGIVRSNLAILHAFFADFPELFTWKEPDGGCVGFVRYHGADGVESFTRRLVEEAGVLLLPASIYRSDLSDVPGDYFRIGFGHARMREGIAVMREWILGSA